jgi:AcrR family transcriptional regulator
LDGTSGTLQRPRSKESHQKVLDAAIELFAARGIEGTSIDSIAAASGVSKATIYKHWADKNALCLEALARVHGHDREPIRFDSGDVLQDLTDLLNHKPPEELNELRERMMPHLIAYASRNREFGTAWRQKVMEPVRVRTLEVLERGIARGVFPPDLDLQLSLALLIGPLVYGKILRDIATTPDNLGDGVANAFWRAFAIREPQGKP